MKEADQRLIDDFYQALIARGLSSGISARHRDNLRFFAEAFLSPSEGMELSELDSETVEYFFTRWYPARVNGSKSDLSGFIPSLRKFYHFLFERGEVSKRSLEEILGVLSRKDYLLGKFLAGKGFGLTLSPDSGNGTKETASPVWLDRSLYFLVRNLDKPKVRMLLDFQLFLDYLIHHPVRLTPSTGGFSRKDIHRINEMMSEPENLAQNAHQDSSRRLNLFYHIARNLDLFLIGSDFGLMLTPRVELFLEMDSDQQIVVLLDALWNRVRWSELQRFGSNSFAGWAQEQRGGFAELLSRLPVNSFVRISGADIQDRNIKLLANYLTIYEVVEEVIMFGLKELGILDYQLETNGDKYLERNHRGINSLLLTGFGKKVMRYFARRAREEMGVESLMDLMEDGLIYL